MQRLFNIDKWTEIPSGKTLKFSGSGPRKVQLEVNCPVRTQLHLTHAGKTSFLALVEGRDSIEFYVTGAFGISSSGADCYVYTIDGQVVEFEDISSESFAVVREFRERNYELELIAARMAENLNRRLELQADELMRRLERRAGAGPGEPPLNGGSGGVPGASSGTSDTGAPAPSGGAGEPGAGSAKGRKATGSGGSGGS